MASEEWRDDVYKKLADLFEDDAETLSRVMFYLDQEQIDFKGNLSPSWRTLKNSISLNPMFRSYAKRLADKTKEAESDNKFRKTMEQLRSNMFEPSDRKADIQVYQKLNPKKFTEIEVFEKAGLIGFARAWTVIPDSCRNLIMAFVENHLPNKCHDLIIKADKLVTRFNYAGSKLATVSLSFVLLSYDAIQSIRRWWKGEISGSRCCKNIIDSLCTTTASVGGAFAGAGVGSLFGPIGAFAGGLVGSVLFASTVSFFSDRLTQWLFGLPREEALENAFRYFNLKCDASNNEINTVYRKLCKKHHPDKGGRAEDFHFVQYNMAVIKASRGEL